MLLKSAARLAVRKLGVLTVLRLRNRRKFGVLMLHSFREADCANVDALCAYTASHFEPVTLALMVDALEGRVDLPDNAVTVTVDDGYRSFWLYGHPIFKYHRLPVTLYAVSGFADGRLWLWFDQIEFALTHTRKPSIRIDLNGNWPIELTLTTPREKKVAIEWLTEALKNTSNERRLQFMADLGPLCGVEIPPEPPFDRAAMSWDELRAVAAEGVEIGCHTDSHPILSRMGDPAELDREIRGAKEYMERRLGFPVRHFCYPNGKAADISAGAVSCVRDAGYSSAVTCNWGLNTLDEEKFQIRRIPLESGIDLDYGAELLAGLHT